MALFHRITEVLKTDLNKEINFRKKVEQPEFESTFVQNLQKRRSIYALGKKVHQSQNYLSQLIFEAVKSCPAAYNAQTTRVIVLFNQSHLKFWQLAQDVQERNMPEHVFEGEKIKLNQCKQALGTILFFEDQQVLKELQKQKPLYAADLSTWSEQTSGMAQFAAWTALSETGLGASLQHYNPMVDSAVETHFSMNRDWKLRAQLVFGSIEKEAEEKPEIQFDKQRFKVYA